MLVAVLGEELLQNNQSFQSFAAGVVTGSCFIFANMEKFNYHFMRKKALMHAEDANASELFGSTPPHPVTCPVIIFSFPLKNKHHVVSYLHSVYV